MNHVNYKYKKLLIKEDLISTSISKERDRTNYYQRLTLRFLPFNVGISRLMKELAKESEQRLQVLIQLGQHSDVSDESFIKPHLSASGRKSNSQHFFVIDSTMAVDILEQAWQEEYKVKSFYEDLKSYNVNLDLDDMLEGFIKQAKQQASILQECKDQAFLLGQWRRDQGIFRRIV